MVASHEISIFFRLLALAELQLEINHGCLSWDLNLLSIVSFII